MHPLIRFAAALILLFLAALSVLAGSTSSRPVQDTLLHPWQIKKIGNWLPDSGSVKTPDEKSVATTVNRKTAEGRICSCQVLNLISSNYDHRYVVLLSEKTNAEGGTGFKDARKRLQKEKKRLKKLFYDRVKLVAEMQSTGSCKSLYFRLHSTDGQLQLYEILNAD